MQRFRDAIGCCRGLKKFNESFFATGNRRLQLMWERSSVRSTIEDTIEMASNFSFKPISATFLFSRMKILARQSREIVRSGQICSSLSCRFSSLPTPSLSSSLSSSHHYVTGSNEMGNERPVVDEMRKTFPMKQQVTSVAKKFDGKQRLVPSSRLGRLLSFGSLAVGLGMGTISEVTRRTLRLSSTPIGDDMEGSKTALWKGVILTESNAQRIVNTLCRVRGAALKLGQMISIQDNAFIQPQIQEIFHRVRQNADYMPSSQMHGVMAKQFGKDWKSKFFRQFDERPFAAASIGQVHAGVLLDGQSVAVKVQYPGVAESIISDVDNLMNVLSAWNILPPAFFADKALEVAKTELAWECDYVREAEFCSKFHQLLTDDETFIVPKVIPELSNRVVLTLQYEDGVTLDQCDGFSEELRNWIGTQILRLAMKELFVFRCMQTDPNWANFLYDPNKGKIVLLDFGASRTFSKTFVDNYIKIVQAASVQDEESVMRQSTELGFLTGYESDIMKRSHVEAVSILGEALTSSHPFDFGSQSTTSRITRLIPTMLNNRLCPPPEETYSLHRKLSGCFLLCTKLKATIACSPIFQNIWSNYTFGV